MASAALGRAPRGPAVLRNVIGGAIAMGVTYAAGALIGAAGIGPRDVYQGQRDVDRFMRTLQAVAHA
jgi:hypothetical protein